MNQYEQLNRGQSDAVMHADGPCVVIAPPGSGKTKVLTLRIGALIGDYGVPPRQILVVTFTRSAAEQMRERYLQSSGKTETEAAFGTFHAVFFRILRESLQMGARLDGYRMGQPLRILSEREKREILTSIVNQTKARREQFPDIEQLCAYVSKCKNRMEAEGGMDIAAESSVKEPGTAADEESSAQEPGHAADEESGAKEPEDAMDADCIAEKILREYRRACRELGVLDFEDITVCCLRLLQDTRNAHILTYWRDKYRYFLVDEFQDVSPLQFMILRLIAAPHDNLFMVGDDDQSIYGFRGSDPKLMLALSSYYPQMRICYLTVNYRSGRRIVEAARHLIAQNKLRYEKEITAGRTVDGSVRIVVCPEKRSQARAVYDALCHVPEDETAAVIVRTNAQAAEMERIIGQTGLRVFAARSREAQSIYAHPVAKDVLAYLLLAAESVSERKDANTVRAVPTPECLEALLRIVNKPYRAVSRHAVIASRGSIEMLVRFYEGNEAMGKTLHTFQAQLQCLAKLPPFAALAYLCRGIGYERTLPDETVRGGEAREEALFVLGALRREAKEMQDQREWIHAAADGRAIPMQTKEPQGRTRVITMHACKGLEFDHVVLPGLNEGVIPHKKAFLPEEIEEERRLLYVAMTRARKTLLMTCVHKQGDQKFQMSRFLRDLI